MTTGGPEIGQRCSNCELETDVLVRCPCDLPQPCRCADGVCRRCERSIRGNVQARHRYGR